MRKLVLVTGATGFVGTYLCRDLLARGYRVRAAVRSATQKIAEKSENIETVAVGEIQGGTNWKLALEGVDAVAHLAGRAHRMDEDPRDPAVEGLYFKVNVDGTKRLAEQAIEAGVKRLVYVSSVKAAGEDRTEAYRESDAPAPEDAYGRSKLEAERVLADVATKSGLEFTVLRPPLVYGPGVKANFAKLAKIAGKGWPFPLGAIRNRRSLVFVGNLTDAIIQCLEQDRAKNQTYFVSDGSPLSTPEIYAALARASGKRPRLVRVPLDFLELACTVLGKSQAWKKLSGNLELDITKLRSELGWTPPFRFEEGVSRTLERQSP